MRKKKKKNEIKKGNVEVDREKKKNREHGHTFTPIHRLTVFIPVNFWDLLVGNLSYSPTELQQFLGGIAPPPSKNAPGR